MLAGAIIIVILVVAGILYGPYLPGEEDVLLMAAQWTIDPMMPNERYEKGTGFVGIVSQEELV